MNCRVPLLWKRNFLFLQHPHRRFYGQKWIRNRLKWSQNAPFAFICSKQQEAKKVTYRAPEFNVQPYYTDRSGRQVLFTDRPKKYKLGKGRWNLAFCQVLLNSVQRFQWRSRNVKVEKWCIDMSHILLCNCKHFNTSIQIIFCVIDETFLWIDMGLCTLTFHCICRFLPELRNTRVEW